MKPKTKLFLHMGPGFHSQIEASIFGNKMPEMEFWSQPKVDSFSTLVKSAVEVFLDLKREKVELYAHSFGAQLALKLAQQFPNKIGKIILLNSSVNPFNCFLNVGLKLSVFDKNEVEKLKSASSVTKMEAIFKVARSPDFNSAYWFSRDKQKQIEAKCFSQFPPVDLAVFANVFKDFLDHQESTGRSVPWSGPVQAIYSENDVLLNYAEDVAPWIQVFPNIIFKSVKDVGHYAHLENPAVADQFFCLAFNRKNVSF